MRWRAESKKADLYRLCELAVFIVIAMMLSYLEHLFPLTAVLPVPGLKLGLSNILSMYLITRYRFIDGAVTAIARSLLSFLLFGNALSLILSLSGNCAAILFTLLFRSITSRGFSLISLGIIGALAFNIFQICASALFYGVGVFYYLPVLLFASLLTGTVTGYIGNLSFERIDKILKTDRNTK